MITFKVNEASLAALKAELSGKARAQVQAAGGEVVKRYAQFLIFRLASMTPQWQGTAAANWKVATSMAEITFDKGLFDQPELSREQAKSVGHPDAVSYAETEAVKSLKNLVFVDKVVIGNATPYAVIPGVQSFLGNGMGLRAENMPAIRLDVAVADAKNLPLSVIRKIGT